MSKKTPIALLKFKCIDQQWLATRSFLDSFDIFKLKPRLNLYSKINPALIECRDRCDQQLSMYIDFNEKLQQQYSEQFFVSSIIMQDLSLQILQLRIAKAFNAALNYRMQHNFLAAMNQIEISLELIKCYDAKLQETPLKGFPSVDQLLCLAYYHKAKIHRMLAGYDLDQLDYSQLCACQANYLEALKLNPTSPAIHSSIGFLYIDMGKSEESLYHHECANQLQPDYPDYIHGLAYVYFNIEKQKSDRGVPIDKGNLVKADELFENAVRLFSEFQSINSRVYLDRGKLKLLMDQPEEALNEFNKGLSIEPHHSLLLLERGLLLGKLGRYDEALTDLRKGCVAYSEDLLMHEKYSQAIGSTQNNKKTVFEDNKNELIKPQHINNRALFEDALKKCAEYADKRRTCFISYAWNNPYHEQWVEQFAADLEKAGFNVILDRWFTRKGHETWSFVEKMLNEDTDYIIVVGTRLYLEKYKYTSLNESDREHVVKMEARLVNYLMGFNQIKSNKIIPILLEGTPQESLPPLLHCKNIADFTKTDYCHLMLELIRDLHQIDQRDEDFKKLQLNDF